MHPDKNDPGGRRAGRALHPQALHPSAHVTRGGFGLYCTVYISAIFGIHTGPTCSLDYLPLMHPWSHLDPVWIEMQFSDPWGNV